ncbi:hypothetical protein CH371_18280 [Leptospira wolffii]|uniref:Peptidase S26 domain-containing protein n=1 Tax=Leptospira wolffii TaxID=409998 RepID=A0A2M9Z7M3_9LEPT|nr:S26 family signal peptidase [Leptospira wolffii]PJZ64367.1 hypothetical protein CH371_18280 [Leptospira wolffii]
MTFNKANIQKIKSYFTVGFSIPIALLGSLIFFELLPKTHNSIDSTSIYLIGILSPFFLLLNIYHLIKPPASWIAVVLFTFYPSFFIIYISLSVRAPDLNYFSFLIASIAYLILVLSERKNAKYIFAIIISVSSLPFGLLYLKKFKKFGVFLTISWILPTVILWSIYAYADHKNFAIIISASVLLYILYFSALLIAIIEGKKDKDSFSQTKKAFNLRFLLFSLYCAAISISCALMIDFLYSEKLNIYMAKGRALEPNILDGDILIVKRDGFTINRGDIVLRSYDDSSASLVRIIGTPGDKVDCKAIKDSLSFYHMEVFINNAQLPIERNYEFRFGDWENNTRPELDKARAYDETIDGRTYQIIVPLDDPLHDIHKDYPSVLPNHLAIQLEKEEYYPLDDDRLFFCYASLMKNTLLRTNIQGKLFYRIFSIDWAHKKCRDSEGAIKSDSAEYCKESLWPRIYDSKFRFHRIGPI